MSLGRLNHRLGAALVSATVVAASLVGTSDARADGPVQTWGKGTAGGALLGAEVIIIPMGAAGVNRGWPYFVFGAVGMAGGAVGGYFLDKHFAVSTNAQGMSTGGPAEPSVFMLAGGLALVIPALVLALNATAYKPPEGSDRVEPANNRPASEPPPPGAPPPGAPPPGPPPGGAAPSPLDAPPPPAGGASYQYRSRYRSASAGMPHIPTALLDMYAGKVGMGLPAAQVRSLYSQAEMARFGVSQGTEVQVPVFKAMF